VTSSDQLRDQALPYRTGPAGNKDSHRNSLPSSSIAPDNRPEDEKPAQPVTPLSSAMILAAGRGLQGMSKVRANISLSADGYVAGPNQSLENPLGEGGESLHGWMVALRAWREPHGREGGEVNVSTPVVEESLGNVGAEIMGRGKFGGGPGPWDDEWRGWWGDEPPFHMPVFVLTHHEREPLTLSDTTFTFVTDGIEAALDRARDAAAGKDVLIGGGAGVINQCLAAGLVDELHLHVVPSILGGGARLFDGVGPDLRLEQVRAIEAPGVTHLEYRVVR
jgi:dihydrofolate reductase